MAGRRPVGEPLEPWDPGLQVERTALAWNRTLMALLAFAMLTVKLVATSAWVAGTILVSAGLTAAVMAGTSRRRYRLGDAALRSTGPLPDARLPAALASGVCVISLIALVWVAR